MYCFCNHKKIVKSVPVYCLFTFLMACTQNKQFQLTEPSRHWAQVDQMGVGRIYLDKVPNLSVMKASDNGNTIFSSYLIGFEDSLIITDRKKMLAKGKYYQYDMQKDWIAIVGKDSIKPVFFQPKVKTNPNVDEVIIIFELPPGRQPDTLIYNDSYGAWGIQKVIIK